MKEYILKGNSDKPMEEEIIPFGVEEAPSPPPSASAEAAAKTVRFFKGEDADDFIEKEALADLVAYAHSMKKTLDDVEAKYTKAKEEIKKRLIGEMQGKKLVKDFGDNQVILTKKAGSVKFDAEKYIIEVCGAAEWKKIEETKEMFQKDQVSSPFFTKGKESVSIEVV